MKRNRNPGVQKVCKCGHSKWPKCPHAWYFRFKPRGKPRWQLSLDVELGRHLETLTDAEREAARIRAAILAGTFQRRADAPPTLAAATGLTLDEFTPIYIAKAAQGAGKVTWTNDVSMLARLCAFQTEQGPLGGWKLSLITEDVLEAFYRSLSGLAVSTRNQYAQILTASFRWAKRKGFITTSPISEDSSMKRGKVAQRRRRLSPDEEAALLTAARALDRRVGLRLSGLVIAALETACRRGELLALQWADVDLVKQTIFVRAVEVGAKKTGRARKLPMSIRLKDVLLLARLDPAGREYPPSAYVFGQMGARIRSIKKTWETAVLKAHGREPTWVNGALSLESRAVLAMIDLHFHDLRHEAGSRWLEQGWPLHHIQEMLGHANIAQTSTYLHAAEQGLQESMQRFSGKTVVNQPTIEPPTYHHDDDEQAATYHGA